MVKKRKRGAQPGNHNAIKHGFYSPTLSPEEISAVWNSVNLKGVDPYTAVLRVKLAVALQNDPSNHRLLEDTAKVLIRKRSSEHRMDAFDKRQFRAAILSALEVLHPAPPISTGRNEAGRARTSKQDKTRLSTLKPRRRTNRDCQVRMQKQDESRLF